MLSGPGLISAKLVLIFRKRCGRVPGYPQPMMPGMAPMAPGMQPMAQGMPQGYAMPTMMPGMQPMAHGMPQSYAMSGGAQGSGDHHEGQLSPKRRKRQAPEEEQDGEYPNTRKARLSGCRRRRNFTTTSRN